MLGSMGPGDGANTRVQPDVAVLDVLVPDGNGVPVVRRLAGYFLPELWLMSMLSWSTSDEVMLEAIFAGASGRRCQGHQGDGIGAGDLGCWRRLVAAAGTGLRAVLTANTQGVVKHNDLLLRIDRPRSERYPHPSAQD